jgi:hypothetical protein
MNAPCVSRYAHVWRAALRSQSAMRGLAEVNLGKTTSRRRRQRQSGRTRGRGLRWSAMTGALPSSAPWLSSARPSWRSGGRRIWRLSWRSFCSCCVACSLLAFGVRQAAEGRGSALDLMARRDSAAACWGGYCGPGATPATYYARACGSPFLSPRHSDPWLLCVSAFPRRRSMGDLAGEPTTALEQRG